MDNCSLFSHHSSEQNFFKDRGSERSQKLVQDWVNSFPPGNLLKAASYLNFSRPGSATADHPVQETAGYNPLEQQEITTQILNQAAQIPSDLNAFRVSG